MILYLLRHAIAVDRRGDFTASDAARPLTRGGRKKMKKIARGMQTLGLSFDLIVSSPLTRARETAHIVADAFDLRGNLEFSPHLSPGGDAHHLFRGLSARGRAPKSLLVVGHEPQLGNLIVSLLSGDATFSLILKKGGLCKLTLPSLPAAGSATLEWLLTPSQLVHLSQVR